MRRFKWRPAYVILFAALVLSGCADRVMVTSFQDITSESKRQGWFYGRQYSAISIPGFIAAYEPGNLFSYNPARGPMTAMGVAPGKDSLVVTKTVDGSKNVNVAGEIKELLEEIKSLTLETVQLRLETLKKNVNDSQGSDEQKPFTVFNTNAASEYETKLGELKTKEKELSTKLKDNGVMIFRWAQGSETSAQAKVSEIASANASSSTLSSGYAIINGLRVSTLYVGNDILDQWNNVEDIGVWRAWPQVVTQVAQARQIAYASELNLEDTFQAELNISGEVAEKIAKDWKQEVSLVLKAFSARFQRTANSGVVGEQAITWHKVDWAAVPGKSDPAAMADHLQGWTTFFQVSTSLKALKKTMGGNHPMPTAQ